MLGPGAAADSGRLRHGLQMGGGADQAIGAPTITAPSADHWRVLVRHLAGHADTGRMSLVLFFLLEGHVLVPNTRWSWV